METSDSEYFESADEYFDSDNEEDKEKPKHSVGQNLSHKIIEPEVCKLKEDKNNKNTIQEEKDQEVTNLGSVQQNDLYQSSSEESSIPSALLNKECDNRNLIKTNQNVNKEKPKIKDEEKYQGKLVENGNKEMDTLIIAEVPGTLSPVSKSTKNPESYTQLKNTEYEPKQELMPKSDEEENLWNDDEIDWELEAAKEESQKTEDHSPNSKNEDSGWDDFDVEWQSESPVSPEESVEFKTESVPDKSTTGQIECNNTSENNIPPSKENMWEDYEDWEPLEKPKDKSKPSEEQAGWAGWGSWGVSTLLNTASQGVSTLTSHMSQGFSTVLESGMGIPDPEEMAKMNKLRQEVEGPKGQKKQDFMDLSDDSSGFGLDNLVSGMSQLTKFVESTGSKVITGGLDTLEAIGKKTVEVLQEGDPGLKKKKAFLKLDPGKPNLSQILREAKEKDEEENKELQQKYTQVKRTKNYEALFDDHQGLVHLEALEMLSRLCSIKVSNLNNSLSRNALKDMQETLEQVKELCELLEDDEEEQISLEDSIETVSNAVKEINIPISYDKLFLTCKEADAWLNNINLDFIDDTELHQQAIETLAQLTACAVEQFHKTGELLLVKDHRSTADEADSLVQITTTLKALILSQAGKFTDRLSSIENANKDNISEHITNIFYEAANSATYIQDAFHLLIPVLQVGAV